LHPGKILTAFFTRPPVATGGFAADRSEDLTCGKRGGLACHGEKKGNCRGRTPSVKSTTAHTRTLAKSKAATPDNNRVRGHFRLTNQKSSLPAPKEYSRRQSAEEDLMQNLVTC